MGSKNQVKKQPTDKPANIREGYKRASQRIELSGYWVPEAGAIHGLLVGAFEFKQRSGKGRGQIRIAYAFRLIEPCIARVKVEGGGYEEAELAKGEFCGVYGGPGLSDLMGLYGCKVIAARKPQKKLTKNGNEMWEYDIDYAGTRRPLSVRRYVETQRNEPEPGDTVEPEDGDSFNPDDYAF